MIYKVLSENLHATADSAAEYFKASRGIVTFKREEEVLPDLEYRPTLHAITSEHYYLCIEACDTPYVSRLDAVAHYCTLNGKALKLYVAFPGSAPQPTYKHDLDRARQYGIGVVDVGATRVKVVHEALPFSLAAYRIDRDAFPRRYKSALTDAENTYRDGTAVKGCAVVYDEIEDLTRRIARKTVGKGMWRMVGGVLRQPSVRVEDGSWARLVDDMLDGLEWAKCGSLARPLMKRVAAITDFRNAAGHKPRNLAELLRRDRELRTRFESAIDLLRDLVEGTRHLRV